MADKAKTIEGPAGYNGKSGPSSNDLKLPIKNYPGSDKLPWGKGTTIDGPCKDKAGYHK